MEITFWRTQFNPQQCLQLDTVIPFLQTFPEGNSEHSPETTVTLQALLPGRASSPAGPPPCPLPGPLAALAHWHAPGCCSLCSFVGIGVCLFYDKLLVKFLLNE